MAAFLIWLSLSIYSFTALYLLPVVLYALSTYGKCHVKWKLLAPDIRENETLYRPKMNTAANAHTSKYLALVSAYASQTIDHSSP